VDLAKAVKDYDLAQIQGNRAELERLLADDYTLLNSTGKIQSKADLIADYTAPGFKLEPFEVREPIEKAWDRGAVMGGIATLRGVDAGVAPVNHFLFVRSVVQYACEESIDRSHTIKIG
jgi:hypothetical protein